MKTFYRREMVLPYSKDPGPRKAGEVMRRLGRVDAVSTFSAAAPEALFLVHDPGYVLGVLAGVVATGFGVPSTEVARQSTWTAGAMLAATENVLGAKAHKKVVPEAPYHELVACVPASGFHHAHYERGSGYCTFNALVLSILRAREFGAQRVLILDGDAHYGDGTDTLLTRLQLPSDEVVHVTGVGRRWLPAFTEVLNSGPWDLILYQAGADAHEDDPYGAGYLSDKEWMERDALVFESARHSDSPVVWCFAGGYNGEKTLSLHARTFHTATQIADRRDDPAVGVL